MGYGFGGFSGFMEFSVYQNLKALNIKMEPHANSGLYYSTISSQISNTTAKLQASENEDKNSGKIQIPKTNTD